MYQKEGFAGECLGTLKQRAEDTAGNIHDDRTSPGGK